MLMTHYFRYFRKRQYPLTYRYHAILFKCSIEKEAIPFQQVTSGVSFTAPWLYRLESMEIIRFFPHPENLFCVSDVI